MPGFQARRATEKSYREELQRRATEKSYREELQRRATEKSYRESWLSLSFSQCQERQVWREGLQARTTGKDYRQGLQARTTGKDYRQGPTAAVVHSVPGVKVGLLGGKGAKMRGSIGSAAVELEWRSRRRERRTRPALQTTYRYLVDVKW
ncbi:hypothetical protein GCM10009554_28100 [Kribbella koreensis]|uniref:Uncharacterized protein n=1 Tax=Kribbella koreensis TaxID=57909 RepID=A0ABP4AMM2_9ACTN